MILQKIIIICCFTAQETFLLIISVENILLFKAAVRKFCLFVAISVWNLLLQLLADIFLLCGLCSGTAPVRINLMFWGVCLSVCQSPHWCGYCTQESQILAYVLEFMTQIEFSPYIVIWTSNKSATFVLTNWGKKSITIHRATNGD